MANHCILLIEDQAEVRRMLRQSLFYLEQGMRIIELPSGEEALLVLSSQSVDLAIVDVRLVGISGLDFLERARQRQPGLKVILMTGMTDPLTRQQLSEAGADAYFFKPLEMPAFLQAIKRCLLEPPNEVTVELETGGKPPPAQSPGEGPANPPDLSSWLEELRSKAGVDALLLLGNQLDVLGTAGSFPDGSDRSTLLSSLVALLSASTQLLSCIGDGDSKELISCHGARYDLYAVPVESWGYLAAFSHAGNIQRWEGKQVNVLQAAASLAFYFQNQVETLPPGEDGKSQERQAGMNDGGSPGIEDAPELLDLFSQAGDSTPDVQGLDAFWEEAATQESDKGLHEAGRLSFEQARKLGLAPDG